MELVKSWAAWVTDFTGPDTLFGVEKRMLLEDDRVAKKAADTITQITGEIPSSIDSPPEKRNQSFVARMLVRKEVYAQFAKLWGDQLWKMNPHGQSNLSLKKSVFDPHFPGPDPGEAEYYRNAYNYEFISRIHYGQLKLLCGLLYFIVNYADRKKDTIVYAGAASGSNIVIAAKLFPHIHFILYDPGNFDSGLAYCKNVELHNDYFTDETAKETAQLNPLFISDIRRPIETEHNAVDKEKSRKESDQTISEDMVMQQKWAMMMPRESMLKFRLTWNPGETEYMGPIELLLQAFPGAMSTELRLITSAKMPKIKYDRKFFERALFHFNNRSRTNWYDHDIVFPGVDHCFDCKYMIFVFEQVYKWYCKQYNAPESNTGRRKVVRALIAHVERAFHRNFVTLTAEQKARSFTKV